MKKSYLIVGFTDKNKMADYEKSYIRKGNALKRIEKWLKENGIEFETIVKDQSKILGGKYNANK